MKNHSKKTVKKEVQPVSKQALDLISPVDTEEVREFDSLYGSLIADLFRPERKVNFT